MKQPIKPSSLLLLAFSAILIWSAPVWAGEPATGPTPAAARGILPLPDYSGDLLERAYLLGDLGGKRSEWAEKGITFDLTAYQYLQSVVRGGADNGANYGGVFDWNVAIDFDRMGLIPGGLLQMRAVSRYGESANGASGAAIPVNTKATTPTTSGVDDDVFLYLPSITYTQFLSEKFAIIVGKIVTYPQSNEFSGGSGEGQFWNLNVVAPVTPLLTVPYSTLGGGVIIMPTENLTLEMILGTTTDVSNSSGLGDLDEGLFGLLKVGYQYKLGNLPGGLINQFGIGFNNDFAKVNGRFNLGAGGLTPTTEDTSWFNSSSIWQYLWVEPGSTGKVDVNNGVQDLQGIGLFSRYKFSDEDTNPIDYIFSVGLGAKGLIPGRDNDTMGIAYTYGKLEDTRLGGIFGISESSTVWEAYYNIELTPAVHLSLDAQIVDGVFPGNDTAVILGSRLKMRF